MDKKNIAASSTLALALSVFSASYSLAAVSKVPAVAAPVAPTVVSAPPGLEGRVSPTASFLDLGDGHFALRTPDAPTPGNYSQGRLYDEGNHYLLEISGQTGNNPKAEKEAAVDERIGPQTAQALTNMGAILRAAGGELRHITRIIVYMNNLQLDDLEFERDYANFFTGNGLSPDSFPSRAKIGGAQIPHWQEPTVVEIVGTARIPKNKVSQ